MIEPQNNKWSPLTGDAFNAAISAANAVHEREYFSPKTAKALVCSLPFYQNLKLLKATEYAAWPPLSMQFLYNEDGIIKLDHTPFSIEKANHSAPLQLTADNVIDYVRFFFDSVRGESLARFKIIEKFADIEFSDEYQEGLKSKLSELLKPAIVKTQNNEGFEVQAFLLYSNCLYNGTLSISREGKVEVKDETLIEQNLPTDQINRK